MSSVDPRPLGVFDSGVGGLTVLRALRARLPAESTVYLGDTARVPYGTKSAEVVTRYAELNAAFLLSLDIKLLVVACNTASAVALPALRAATGIPVVGVIEPGARAAAARSRSGVVGVLGTPGTIRSGAYQQILAVARPGLTVQAQACPLFVPLAEEGWLTGDVPRLVAERYLLPWRGTGVDTVVLGCTHYPLLRGVLSEVLGAEVTLVDSAEATAETVARLLAAGPTRPAPAGKGEDRFYVTDVPDRFLEVSTRFLGTRVVHAEQVDLPLG
ncbi:MAG TPA: glutamate racemase [Myxococcaceae bacterium]|jgi:glutamate racemase|nr:glutamate racemase [Myxococcaceae bacterium]